MSQESEWPLLSGKSLTLSYGARPIVQDLSVSIPEGKLTVVIGPNACGKSTLLRALSRLLSPEHGQVLMQGRDVTQYSARAFARLLGMLPQSSRAPAGICVADLVARGRFPHQRLFRQWQVEDDRAVEAAMEATGVSGLAEAAVDELSGGQRQRVWLAMLLAQQTPVMLLDEPTTWLDIAHQLEVLELCRRLNRNEGRTLVVVLHDLNQAARYADHLIVMKAGRIVGSGPPESVMTEGLVEDVFHIRSRILSDPVTGRPWILPLGSTGHMED